MDDITHERLLLTENMTAMRMLRPIKYRVRFIMINMNPVNNPLGLSCKKNIMSKTIFLVMTDKVKTNPHIPLI